MQALALVDALLRRASSRASASSRSAPTASLTGDVRIQFEDRVELPRLYLAWLTPAMFAEGDADLDLATDLLANGKTSRLYRRLVFDERIATDVSASQNSREMAGYAQITATAAPGHTLAELERGRSSRRSPGSRPTARPTRRSSAAACRPRRSSCSGCRRSAASAGSPIS